MMAQRDTPHVKNIDALLDSFDEFVRRKPSKLRNIYWRAYFAAWIAAEKEVK